MDVKYEICGVGEDLLVPWTPRRSNQSILKEITPEYSLEGRMLKLKLQYFGHLMLKTDSLEKTLKLGKIEGRRRKGWQRMRSLHHWLNGHEFEQALGVGDGQGSLACCGPHGWEEVDTTEQLNWTESMRVDKVTPTPAAHFLSPSWDLAPSTLPTWRDESPGLCWPGAPSHPPPGLDLTYLLPVFLPCVASWSFAHSLWLTCWHHLPLCSLYPWLPW